MRKLLTLVTVQATSLLICTNAFAAPILIFDDDGKLSGARHVLVERFEDGKGIPVGDGLYDVEFVHDGLCIGAGDLCGPTFTFTTQGDAFAAANALLREVFLDGPLGNFDSDTSLITNCDSSCRVFTPYALELALDESGVSRVRVAETVNRRANTTLDSLQPNSVLVPADLSQFHNHVMARWSPTRHSVPEPATSKLLILALAASAACRHRWSRTG